MPAQKQLILQETFEAIHLAMDDLIGHANDLESVHFNRDAEELRELIGQLEHFVHRMRVRHS